MFSRMKSPFKRRTEHSDIKYLQFTHLWSYYNRTHYGMTGNDDDDDINSVLTVSTNATMDNNPGTGRTIDTFLYQYLGRKLERIIFRMSMEYLSPDRILQFLMLRTVHVDFFERPPLSEILRTIPNERVSGLKSLVKQSQ